MISSLILRSLSVKILVYHKGLRSHIMDHTKQIFQVIDTANPPMDDVRTDIKRKMQY